MELRFWSRWTNLHWITRIVILAELFAILWWQARYTWNVHNPPYGWPVSFNNVDYGGRRSEWCPWLLALNATIWVVLLASVGDVLERLRRSSPRFQFSLRGLLGFQAVVAVLLALGYAEAYLRAHPKNGVLFPRYACRDVGGVPVWFDIGLFTDPPLRWPLPRIAMIFAIGCAVYAACSSVGRVVRCEQKERHSPSADALPCPKDPTIARVIQWALAIVDAFLSMVTSSPPAVY